MIHLRRNLNDESINCLKLRKIDSIEQKICICHSPTNDTFHAAASSKSFFFFVDNRRCPIGTITLSECIDNRFYKKQISTKCENAMGITKLLMIVKVTDAVNNNSRQY